MAPEASAAAQTPRSARRAPARSGGRRSSRDVGPKIAVLAGCTEQRLLGLAVLTGCRMSCCAVSSRQCARGTGRSGCWGSRDQGQGMATRGREVVEQNRGARPPASVDRAPFSCLA